MYHHPEYWDLRPGPSSPSPAPWTRSSQRAWRKLLPAAGLLLLVLGLAASGRLPMPANPEAATPDDLPTYEDTLQVSLGPRPPFAWPPGWEDISRQCMLKQLAGDWDWAGTVRQEDVPDSEQPVCGTLSARPGPDGCSLECRETPALEEGVPAWYVRLGLDPRVAIFWRCDERGGCREVPGRWHFRSRVLFWSGTEGERTVQREWRFPDDGSMRLTVAVREGQTTTVWSLEGRRRTPCPEPDSAGPFVLLRKGAPAERGFATLADAVEASWTGDAIEIRGDGPFVVRPLDLGVRPVIVRAAAGFAPRLVGAPEARGLPLIRTRAPLVLEGLTLDHPDSPIVLDALPTQAWIANCDFPSGHLLLGSGSVVNTRFGGPQRSASIEWSRQGPLALDDCIFAGPGYGVGWSGESGRGDLWLNHCTCTAGPALRWCARSCDRQLMPQIVKLAANRFAGPAVLEVLLENGPVPDGHQLQEMLRSGIVWRDDHNEYAEAIGLRITRPGRRHPPLLRYHDAEGWRRLWRLDVLPPYRAEDERIYRTGWLEFDPVTGRNLRNGIGASDIHPLAHAEPGAAPDSIGPGRAYAGSRGEVGFLAWQRDAANHLWPPRSGNMYTMAEFTPPQRP
jgi:hypothetical protein